MAAIAAANVTITPDKATHIITNKRRQITCTIAFGDGALTYPANGVPLPASTSFGMLRFLEDIILTDPANASGIYWKYDRANKKLRGFMPGVIVSAAGAATLDDFATNDAAGGATAMSVGLDNAQGAGTKYLGQQKELATTFAPAAQTLVGIARGW